MDIQKHSAVINEVRQISEEAEIVYIGESSNDSYHGTDLDKRAISEFINDYYPNIVLDDITKAASHAGIFHTLLKNIPNEKKVKTIIVTLNLRSFNAQWINSELETPLQKSMVLLKVNPPLWNRFLLSFKAYDIKSNSERRALIHESWEKHKFNLPFDFAYENLDQWNEAKANHGVMNKDGKRDQKMTELACHYIKAYGFQIDTINNPRIHDFEDIINFAKKRNWNLVFNLLAENHEKAKELCGTPLNYMMEENRKLLKSYFEKRGVLVVDNFHSVHSEEFTDQDWTTEHYHESGRKTVAKNIAIALKKLHPNEYAEVDYNNTYKTYFFNDCEGDLKWGQSQTISTDQAFNGNHSSKTGGGNLYSITFEYPIAQIPDSAKIQLSVRLKYLKKDINSQASLIMQASEMDGESWFHRENLKRDNESIAEWQNFIYSFSIPEKVKKAGSLKIYVYNTSEGVVFIDDFEVKFNH